MTDVEEDPGGVAAARRADERARRERVRRRAVALYLERRGEGGGHRDTFLYVMHEVRELSEDQLWLWLDEHFALYPEKRPADFPYMKPSDARLSPNHPARSGEVEESGYDGPMTAEGAARAADVLRTADDPETALAPEDGKWAFDANVTAAFDDMLARSIPNYVDMRQFVTQAALWHAAEMQRSPSNPVGFVDLGASRGTGLAPILDSFGARGRYVAAETSPPMLEALVQRFQGMIEADVVKVWDGDLRHAYPSCPVAVAAVLSVLTLQFIPIEYRQRLLRNVYESLQPGGCFILVEKVLGATAELDEVEVDLYYGTKRGAGYTQEAIDRKRLSLEGVLVPLTARMNEDLLRDAGFVGVDCCWAWANFRGWLAVKR